MIASRFGIGRPLLRLGRDFSLWMLPLIFAFLAYVAALGGIGLVVLTHSVRAGAQALAANVTVTVPAEASEARLQTALAALRQAPGIVSAQLLDATETERLLRPWLGSSAAISELPVPRLIDLRIDPAGTADLAAVEKQLASIVDGARFDDLRPGLALLRASAARVEAMLAALAGGALVALGLVAVFAIAVALREERTGLELLHQLGAADRTIALPLCLRFLWQGLLGGFVGGGLALLTPLMLRDAGRVVQLPVPPSGNLYGDWRPWVVAAGVAGACGLITLACAGVATQRRLARMP